MCLATYVEVFGIVSRAFLAQSHLFLLFRPGCRVVFCTNQGIRGPKVWQEGRADHSPTLMMMMWQLPCSFLWPTCAWILPAPFPLLLLGLRTLPRGRVRMASDPDICLHRWKEMRKTCSRCQHYVAAKCHVKLTKLMVADYSKSKMLKKEQRTQQTRTGMMYFSSIVLF